MQDRFKFRVYFKGSEYCEAGYQDLTRDDVIFSLRADGQIIRTVVYECQREEHEKEPCMMPFTPDNDLYDIQFCTGLKDKNGKLIYEGDIVRYTEYEIEDIEPEWEQTEIVWGENHHYPAFDLKRHEFECNGLAYIFNEGWTIEVIGNIYENPELLKECENE